MAPILQKCTFYAALTHTHTTTKHSGIINNEQMCVVTMTLLTVTANIWFIGTQTRHRYINKGHWHQLPCKSKCHQWTKCIVGVVTNPGPFGWEVGHVTTRPYGEPVTTTEDNAEWWATPDVEILYNLFTGYLVRFKKYPLGVHWWHLGLQGSWRQ